MTPVDKSSHMEASGANFYVRVEGQLAVIEADVKDMLARMAVLEEKARSAEASERTMSDRLWEIVKFIIVAAIGGAIGAWIKTAKP